MHNNRHVQKIAFSMGFTVLVLFLGYFTHSFMAEAVIYSISADNNGTDVDHGGYYGQALQLATFGFVSLFAPLIVYYLSAQVALAISAVCFASFFAGFLHFNQYYYYVSQGIIGIGTAIFYVAEGVYLTEVSPDENYGYIVSVETTISHSGQLIGGIIMFIISLASKFFDPESTGFNMSYIKIVYGVFVFCSIVAFLSFLLMPVEKADNEANWAIVQFEDEMAKKCEMSEKLHMMLKVMLGTPALTIWNESLYQGVFGSFFLSVYPSVFMFDSRFPDPKNMIAIYCGSIGVGVVIAGIVMARITKKHRDAALHLGFYFHAICVIISFILITLFTPTWAFVGPTNDGSILWFSGISQTIVIGLLVGMGDCFITTFRTFVCQGATENNASEMFATTRFLQALAGGVTLLITPFLSVYAWITILVILITLSVSGVIKISIDIANQHIRNNLSGFLSVSGYRRLPIPSIEDFYSSP